MKNNYIKPDEYAEFDEYSKIFSNPIGRVLHGRRFETIYNLVNKYSSAGDRILDFCCGLCEWNRNKMRVIGLDVNEKALESARKAGRISEAIIADALRNNVKTGSFNMVISSQALEHISNPDEMIEEMKRILVDEGILILAVPYDTFFSSWRPLFFVRCLWDGKIKGNKYFLKNGGHVNHFSPRTLASLLRKHGFKILEIVNDYRFTITLVAKK